MRQTASELDQTVTGPEAYVVEELDSLGEIGEMDAEELAAEIDRVEAEIEEHQREIEAKRRGVEACRQQTGGDGKGRLTWAGRSEEEGSQGQLPFFSAGLRSQWAFIRCRAGYGTDIDITSIKQHTLDRTEPGCNFCAVHRNGLRDQTQLLLLGQNL